MNTVDLQLKVLQAVLKHGVQVQITRNGTPITTKAQVAFYGEKANLGETYQMGPTIEYEKKAVISSPVVIQFGDKIPYGSTTYRIIKVASHKYKETAIAYTVDLDYAA